MTRRRLGAQGSALEIGTTIGDATRLKWTCPVVAQGGGIATARTECHAA